jgi:energy-coupling factor transporter ATP-binding protein EcfA2
MIEGPTASLSGGWRMRLALAQALFVRNSDLILLDECTNHLDLHGMDWLIQYLTTKSNHTLVIVSHDRGFLDAVCTDVSSFDHCTLSVWINHSNQLITPVIVMHHRSSSWSIKGWRIMLEITPSIGGKWMKKLPDKHRFWMHRNDKGPRLWHLSKSSQIIRNQLIQTSNGRPK